MEIKGKVLTLFPVKEGVGKTSGTPWKSREFVIETQDQYPKRICLQVMNDNMDRFPMEEGMEVSVKFDISARERDGRYFNTLTAWDITVLNSRRPIRKEKTDEKEILFLGILLGVCLASPAQFYSARTNLIGLATGNINLEGSMTLNRRWSLHLPVQYNPFVFKDNRQFRNLTVMPGVRYWFVESYSNFFVGMNTLASGYSIGRIWNKKRYEGEGYGIGLSIGKAYPLSKTWNIEWELGGAAVWARYNEYRCRECGAFLGRKHGWYLIPSRVALNMIYLF